MGDDIEFPVEAILRDELAHGNAVLASVGPILGHLVATTGNVLFNDQVVARIRGMCTGMAHEMLRAQSRALGRRDPTELLEAMGSSLASELLADPDILAHCHALTVEAQLASRLQHRSAVDPVVSPLLQSLMASGESAGASGAMMVVAAQARFLSQIERMEHPLQELPGSLFQSALMIWRSHSGSGTEEVTARAEMELRSTYDESATRIGLLSRLAEYLGRDLAKGLSISNAGVAVFLSALAKASGQERDLAILATSEQQMGRMALALRASGLEPKVIEEQFLCLHPDFQLPDGFEMLRTDTAAHLLHAGFDPAGAG